VNAEIVGVGTELLLGQIANTNAQHISAGLAEIGVDVFYHSAVGDNLERMTDVIARAAERSDVVIITGGLGPTPDDITRDAVAAAFDVPLVRRADLAQELQTFFERRGRTMPEVNLRQTDLPKGSVAIAAEGTAPGFFLDAKSALVVALPGVPWEMTQMFMKTVIPLLRERSGAGATVSSEILVVGLGESHTHERIADLVDAQTNPTIAYLAGFGLVRVRVTAKAADEGAARALIAPVEADIRSRLGDHAVEGTGRSLAHVLGEMLRSRSATVAVAESLTGGLMGAALTEAEGSSEFFLGGVVSYATESKRAVLGVEATVLDTDGPVSEAAARQMCEGAARLFGADLGLSATGVAGPGEHDGHAPGTVFVGATCNGRTEVRRVRGYGDRASVRGIAVTSALDLGRLVLPAIG
jgi:nicotinamide-nucleotide amidase